MATSKNRALKESHPGEPWLWRADWAEGRIRTSMFPVVFPVVFAGIWCAVCWPIVSMVLSGKILQNKEEQVFWWVVMGLGVMGIFLVLWAIVAFLGWLKCGRSVFEVASVPGVIGGQLAGVVRCSRKVQAPDGFRVKLSCIHRENTRNSDTISQKILWENEQILARDLLEETFDQTAIPILFQIPYHCRSTKGERWSGDAVFWRLEVTAKNLGLNYHVQFTVPVFRTPESDPEFVVNESLITPYAAPVDDERDLREAGVVRTPLTTGDGQEFLFPMAQERKGAVVTTLLTLMFAGVPTGLWLWSNFDWGDRFFFVVFILAALVTGSISIYLWFYQCKIEASRRGLAVTGGLFGFGRRRWVDAAEVVKIKKSSNYQSNDQKYYHLVIVCRDGRKVTAGKHIPGNRLAMSLIRQIENVMGK